VEEAWITRLLGATDHRRSLVERLRDACTHTRRYRAGHVLLFEDDQFDFLYALNTGWIGTIRGLEDGTVQILDFFLPGQLVGLRQLMSPTALINYQALTDVELTLVSKSELKAAITDMPEINRAILDQIAIEDAWLTERMSTLGQRSAAQCIVHLILEVADRMALLEAGRSTPDEVQIDINQEQIGGILAITPVHVSRILKELREESLLVQQGDLWRFPDRGRAERFCEFDAERLRLIQ
jgi:CRP-like cAMP-binding protein